MKKRLSNKRTASLNVVSVKSMRNKVGRLNNLIRKNNAQGMSYPINVVLIDRDSILDQSAHILVSDLRETSNKVSKNLKYIYESEINDIDRFAFIASKIKE